MQLINQAIEKFQHMQDELCPPLFAMLREINALEKEFRERSDRITAQYLSTTEPKPAPDATPNMWAEYRERYGQIVSDKCTEKLLDKYYYGGRLSSPPQYAYIDGECEVTFTMKVPKRAVIETHYSLCSSVDSKHRFTLIKENNKWLLNSVEHCNNRDTVWHRGSI